MNSAAHTEITPPSISHRHSARLFPRYFYSATDKTASGAGRPPLAYDHGQNSRQRLIYFRCQKPALLCTFPAAHLVASVSTRNR